MEKLLLVFVVWILQSGEAILNEIQNLMQISCKYHHNML